MCDELLGFQMFDNHLSHDFSYVVLYMDRTIHNLSYVSVAGVRGGSRGDGDGGGHDGGRVPTTLPLGQAPGPSRPGTKYPVRGQSLTSIYDKLTPPANPCRGRGWA